MHQLVLFIHKQSGPVGIRLQEMIRLHFSNIPQELCPGLSMLRERLMYPESNEQPVIYILLADSRNRLNQLHDLHGHLKGRRLILILPDSHMATRSIGLRLLPRFLSYANDNFYDLIAVIGKMIGVSIDNQPDFEITGVFGFSDSKKTEATRGIQKAKDQ